MVISVADVLSSGGIPLLADEVYTEEARFILRVLNVFTCQGGPNYNLGTLSILEKVAAMGGVEQTLDLLRLIALVDRGDLWFKREMGYRRFWTLFKSVGEDLYLFLETLRQICQEDEERGVDTSDVIPLLLR